MPNPALDQFTSALYARVVPVVIFAAIASGALAALLKGLERFVIRLKARATLDKQTGLDSIRALPWKEFENLLGEAYRRQGYRVEETLGCGPDGGVDLTLRRDGEVVLVQCKRWKDKRVPVQTVRELFGVLHDRGASAAKLVATTRFTSEAMAFAKGKPIELVDQDSLLELIRGVQNSGRIACAPVSDIGDAPPACPTCGSEMVMRTAKRGPNSGGSFWGCTRFSAGCRGTRQVYA